MSAPWIAAFVALWLVVVLVVVVVLGFLRRATSVLEVAEQRLASVLRSGIDLGGVAPGSIMSLFELRDRTGTTVSSDTLIDEPTLLLFLSPNCAPCKRLVAELRGTDIDGLPFVVVLEDTAGAGEYPLADDVRLLFQTGQSVSQLFESTVTPQAFVVDIGGFVLERVIPNSLADLRQVALRQKGGDKRHQTPAAAAG
jgi:hypothetical protein